MVFRRPARELQPLSVRSSDLAICLASWTPGHLRSYPWRSDNQAPYAVLVSELLVKRTTAAAVARVFPGFLARFPNVVALHAAPPETIEGSLSLVGLQVQRAKSIKAMAAYLIDVHGGEIPSTLPELLKVPGIGAYSARAVLSFGFGVPAAVVDSNVERVLKRAFAKSLGDAPTRDQLQRLADELLPEEHRTHNYAMLDLGAMVCRYNNPRCGECPLAEFCDSAGVPAKPRKSTPDGDELRAARASARISQAALAKRAGVAKATIVGIEYGRRTARPETMRVLREAMVEYSAKSAPSSYDS